MAAHGEHKYQCRGVRKWCDRRCERTTSLRPSRYPFIGFYCNLHDFQTPKVDRTGRSIASEEYLPFLKRCSSFRTEEELMGAAMKKDTKLFVAQGGSPTLVAVGAKLTHWCVTKRELSEEESLDMCRRMSKAGVLRKVVPGEARSPTHDESFDAASFYTLIPSSPAPS